MREHPRRRLLQALAGLTAGSIAGCTGDNPESAVDATTTAEGFTTTGTTATAPRTGEGSTTDGAISEESTTATDVEVATEAWTVDSFHGDVEGLWLPNRPRKPNTTGGPLYAGTTAGTVANVAVASGDVRWNAPVRGDLTPNGAPRVHDVGGDLLVVSHTLNEETLRNYAELRHPDTGEREWTFEVREYLTPLGVVDDVLYLAGEYVRAAPSELGPNQDPSGEGRLHGVDLATGEELWRTTVASLVNATVARHGIYANVTAEDGSDHEFVAFDRDGSERWRTDAGKYHLPEPVAIEDGVVAATGADGVASFAPDGTERWRVSAWRRGPSEIEATSERLYVGSRPLIALSRAGDERWRLDTHGSIIRPIRDQRREETLYFGGGTRVGAIDAGAGKERWSWAPDDEKYVHEQAIVDDGILVSPGIGPDREFVLLDEMNGHVVGEFRTPKPYATATAVASRVFAGTSGGILAYDVEP
ncbi:outer membrane protein assembly factor BamB family protein [Halorussus litoreus]|uniref:outer membrane protein assembly factor BamB family protein n=1 Tax=Halorussus litoreus TaxID=1710536 RepID=UPI000E225F7F|nr:PQQ-binding-like beta-propeller repeat protein [Halorussus litoreus]